MEKPELEECSVCTTQYDLLLKGNEVQTPVAMQMIIENIHQMKEVRHKRSHVV